MIRQQPMEGLRYLFVLAATVAFVAAESRAQNLPDLVENIRPSVVYIATFDVAGKPLMSGTGFAVESNRVITNFHVINGASRVEVKTVGREVFVATSVSPSNKDADLAILHVGDEARLKPIRISSLSPRVGTKIFVLGAPLGLTGTVSDGIVSALRSHPKLGKLIQITAPISEGNSGGPVVNLDGEVVGLVTMGFDRGQNLNFAIASEQLLSFWTPTPGALPKRFSGTSAAKRWRLLDTNMSYDTETLSKKAGIVSTWIRYDKPDGAYSKVFMEVNCSTSRIREVRSLFYRNTTEPPIETIGWDSWGPIVPESKGEVAFDVFCNEKRDYQSNLDWDRYFELAKQGNSYQLARKLEEAIDVFSKIITEVPDYASWGFRAIAGVKLAQGNIRAAKNSIMEAIKLEPLTAGNYSVLGDIYKEEKSYVAAIEAYLKALKLADDEFNRWSRFEVILSLKGIYEERKDYVALTDLLTTAIRNGDNLLYDDLAEVYDKRKMPSRARSARLSGVEYYEGQIRNSGDKPSVIDYWNLTELLDELNDDRKLESVVLTGIKLFPTDSSLVNRLAESYNKRRRWQKSIQLVTEALPRMKDNSSKRLLLHALKAAYEGQGNREEAKRTDAEISRLK